MIRAIALFASLLFLTACASMARQVPDEQVLSGVEADAYRAAADALERGDAAAALTLIAPVSAREPWHVPSHVIEQDALVALGRESEAARAASEEAASHAGDAARALLAARLSPRADGVREKGYRAALALDPDSVWSRMALAYELARGSRDESTRAQSLADGGFAPAAVEASARAASLSEEAERLASSVVAERPELAAAHGALADVLLNVRRGGRGRRVAEALRESEAAARLDPGSAAAWLRLGRARRASSDDTGAAEALARAADIAPDDARTRAGLGRVLLDLRRDDAARTELEAAAAIDPRSETIALDLGVAQFRTENFAAAAATFERAAALAPADPRPFEGLALAHARLGRRAEAAAAMERYLAVGGDDRDAARRFIESMAGPAAE